MLVVVNLNRCSNGRRTAQRPLVIPEGLDKSFYSHLFACFIDLMYYYAISCSIRCVRPPPRSTPLHFRTSSLRPESSSRSCTPPRGPHTYHQCDSRNRIPPREAESEWQPYFDDTNERLPLQTSSSAWSRHLRGQSEGDPEREPIRICASDCGGDATATVGHIETRPARSYSEMGTFPVG